ncbi:MAG: AAC(3) family N-acetyltransferase [Actinobacteria bacterium]|nr:AAC(3) family N-acetyltransferase [Actinomycetota bacterium]
MKTRRNSINLGFVGQAESQFFKQKDIVDFAVEWIEKNRH